MPIPRKTKKRLTRRTKSPVYGPVRMIKSRVNRVPTSNAAAFAGAGFPLLLKMKHIWSNTYNVPLTNVMAAVNTNCIGLYQPDSTTPLTKQPMFFDQMTPIYSRYTVIGAKIKYTIVPFVTGAQAAGKYVSWINENSTGGITDFDALAEYKGAKTRYAQGGLNPDRLVITQKWSTKKHNYGSVLANTGLFGTSGANPLETPRFQLNYVTIDPAGGPASISVNVRVEYIVIWDELKEVAAS